MKPQRALVTCAVCGVEFDPVASIGRWECRTHVARDRVCNQQQQLVYPCCSISYDDNITAYDYVYTQLSQKELLGCVAADHVVPAAVVDPTRPQRFVDDIYLLSDVKHVNAFADIPKAAIVQSPRSWTYGALERAPPDVDSVISKKLSVPYYNNETKRMVTRGIQTSLRDEALATIERAYARPELYETNAALKKKRQDVLRERPSWRPSNAAQKHFLDETKHMNDNDFLVQWFTKMQKDAIPVDLCVVRAVAPHQNDAFLQHLRRQRDYAETHAPLRH
jgi:hypothetical protein